MEVARERGGCAMCAYLVERCLLERQRQEGQKEGHM